MPGTLRPVRNHNAHAHPARVACGTALLFHGGGNLQSRLRVNGGLAHGHRQPRQGHTAHARPAFQRNQAGHSRPRRGGFRIWKIRRISVASPLRQAHMRLNHGSMGGVRVIPAVLHNPRHGTACASRILQPAKGHGNIQPAHDFTLMGRKGRQGHVHTRGLLPGQQQAQGRSGSGSGSRARGKALAKPCLHGGFVLPAGIGIRSHVPVPLRVTAASAGRVTSPSSAARPAARQCPCRLPQWPCMRPAPPWGLWDGRK